MKLYSSPATHSATPGTHRGKAPSPEPFYGVTNDFWNGFGLSGCPDLRGRSVLEIGSGKGGRCFEMAASGAARVVGVEPLDDDVEGCRRALETAPLAWRSRVSFHEGTLETLPDERFDVIISEDSFEHIMNVQEVLSMFHARLKPGGRAYIGFGPLYHAPDGDHGWLRATLPGRRFFLWPWGHLLFEKPAMRALSRKFGVDVRRTHDWPYLDLNQHTIHEFVAMFEQSGLRIVELHTNHTRSFLGHLIRELGRVPLLAKYCTLNLFVVLER